MFSSWSPHVAVQHAFTSFPNTHLLHVFLMSSNIYTSRLLSCTLVYSLLNIFSTLDSLSNLIVNLQDKLVILELLRWTEAQLEPLTIDNLGLIVGLFEVITSHTQKTVALSSTEAKYMALSDCSQQVVWIKNLLNELGINVRAIPINGENQGSIFIGSNPTQEKRSKHIDTHYHYIRQCVEEKKVSLYYVKGVKNPADMFTKNLSHVKFLKFRGQLGFELKWPTHSSSIACNAWGILARGSVEWVIDHMTHRSHDVGLDHGVV